MKNIFISDIAYKEFKDLLDENNVESCNIRINISEYTCSGPIFNIMVSEANAEDHTEVINDITFIVEKSILAEYGGFIIVSNEENDGNGVGLKPVVLPSSGCSGECGSCGGCGDEY
ncbi:HesB-like selenoprotein [Sedimentibacter acidaminivorans]|uniref:HesB-like selenoprotein n=1 Tax=Sedimentibacter acidaminivorans TaxID=913099 RepID=A0ABS4GGH3_9FIRM|nr:HesB-like selenoprotein [Sedimentibacter acidaminivorans]